MLYGRDHDLWIGTDGRGVLHRIGSGTINVSERAGWLNERIRTMHEDALGVLWIATQNGVERFIDGKIEVLSEAGMISGDITTPFAEDGAGGMFFVTSSGLFYWANGTTTAFRFTFLPTMFPSRFIAIPSTSSGSVPRPASYNSLLEKTIPMICQIDSIRCPEPPSIVPSRYCRTTLWIGMRMGGLSRWRRGALAPHGKPEGIANFSANSFADSRGDLWLGT
jgi:ligand-binding sensor domain-containing protein